MAFVAGSRGCAVPTQGCGRRRWQSSPRHPHLSLQRARVLSRRGWSGAPMQHGVSTVRPGRRRTLGRVFNDATWVARCHSSDE
ncbi:2OG-Fe(II) oxygenase [Streptomyces sp. RB17]|uniref:2OG-Fe(II) oxygenase n=1 Tax=Streptomyces sp. RB17 TaxID=2585197 RepID=UPI003A4C5A49